MISPVKLYFVSIVFMTAVLLNGLGCLWHAMARIEGYSNSWLVSVGSQGENLVNASRARQYVASVYFACTTVTTIGYGEVLRSQLCSKRLCVTHIMYVEPSFPFM